MNFLRIFPAYRELQAKLEREQRERTIQAQSLSSQLAAAQQSASVLGAEIRDWKSRYDKANERIEKLTDKIENAGDAVALRVMGRRMFGKAPVEAPPQSKEPVNISAGSGKRFASDVKRQMTAEFFQKIAKEAGVTEGPKPTN